MRWIVASPCGSSDAASRRRESFAVGQSDAPAVRWIVASPCGSSDAPAVALDHSPAVRIVGRASPCAGSSPAVRIVGHTSRALDHSRARALDRRQPCGSSDAASPCAGSSPARADCRTLQPCAGSFASRADRRTRQPVRWIVASRADHPTRPAVAVDRSPSPWIVRRRIERRASDAASPCAVRR